MNSFVKLFALIAAMALGGYFFSSSGLMGELGAFFEKNSNPYIFLLVMSVGCALPLPLTFCYVYAGMTFNPALAWILCAAGLFFSSGIGYFLGRFAMAKSSIERLCLRFNFNMALKKNSFRLNFFVRAVPGIPYWVQNILLASAGTSYGLYSFVNICVQGLIALSMILFFGGFKEGDYSMIAVFVVLAVILAIAYKMAMRFLFRD